MSLLLVLGCLERVTGESKPLPASFTEGVEEGGALVAHQEIEHDPDAGPATGVFGDIEGDSIEITGTVTSELVMAIDIDLQTSDPAAEGGMRQLTKLLMAEPGTFSFLAPVDFGDLTLQAFQDAGGDGPTDDDPFGVVMLNVADEPLTDVAIVLEVGGREKAQLSAGGGSNVFEGHDGEWTTLMGTITSPAEGAVDVDIRVPTTEGASGDSYLGKIPFGGPGPYSLKVPRNHGILRLQVFQDTNANGPDGRDPFAAVEVDIGDVNVVEIDIELSTGAYAAPTAAAATAPSSGGPGGMAEPLFDELGDAPVTVRGTLSAPGLEDATIDLDIFAIDPEGHGGRRYLGKIKAGPGPFSFQAPQSYGEIELEAMVDLDDNGPTPGDPRGVYAGNPLTIATDDVAEVDIVVQTSE